MLFQHRRAEIIFGAFFGAWLGGVYALVSQAINWLFLPGIPLAGPDGGLGNNLLENIVLGALLGIISALPESRWAGVPLGGTAATLLLSYRTLSAGWGMENFGYGVITVLVMFLPLMVMMMPLAYFVRIGVDSQRPDSSRPHLWPRRYLVPMILTLVAVGVGAFSLYSSQVRAAFRYTNQMIQQGMVAAAGQKELPEPLQDVADFANSARGPYTLMWTDRVETFFGPRPEGAELSQFLIITRFENGFRFACVFSENRHTPNCTNH